MNIEFSTLSIAGCGAMGRGIAQIAAQAGSSVALYDTKPGAAEQAKLALVAQWERLVSKNKITQPQADLYASRLRVVDSVQQLAQSDIVMETIVEDMEAKVALLRAVESHAATHTLLCTNTSSLSVTALAAQLKDPSRLAGFHFFNPVPLMKVVEVIGGIKTAPEHHKRLSTYATQLGHAPVMAKDTPGFIVNHAGRGYGTEALRVASEGVADYATIDRILRDQLGFKLGPFELMDLTGLDVSHPVMESIYHQFYDEPRFRPSPLTAQRLAAGMLGRKSHEGFYTYQDGLALQVAEAQTPEVDEMPPVWVSPRAARRAELLQLLKNLGAKIKTGQSPSMQALTLVAPLGFDVTTVAIVERLDPARTVGIDMLVDDSSSKRRVVATNPATRADMRDAAHALFARDGKAVSVIRDSGGFISQRVVAHIVNIACDICQQGICTPKDLETAVTLGLGYPYGPLALGNLLGPTNVLEILFNLQTVYGDPRYRPSPWLRRRGSIGLSLLHTED